MKKLFSVVVALAFAVSLAADASAGRAAGPPESVEQAQGAASGKSARPVKRAEPARKRADRNAPKRRQITGIVKAIDGNAGTLTVQGRKGSVSLKADEKRKLEGIRVGDRVLSMYSGGTAFSVKKVAERKAAGGKQ